MGSLAVMIFERDKERGGGIVMTIPTTRDAVAAKNRHGPRGEATSFARLTALLLLGIVNTMTRRRALHSDKIGASKFPLLIRWSVHRPLVQ